MGRFIARRLMTMVLVIFLVSLVTFSMLHLVPGDPAEMIANESGQNVDINAIRQDLGLDQPLPAQYLRFISNALRGDLGRTFRGNKPVLGEFMSRFPNTLRLAFFAMLAAAIVGGLAGVASAVWRNSMVDYVTMSIAVFGVSMPVFWLGLMLIFVFSYRLGWLPSFGFSTWQQMILPVVTLSTISMATIARLTRSSLLDVLQEDYIRTARAKGLDERVILWRHALKNGLIPILTVVGLQFGILLGGAVITEIVFAIPGVGRLVVDGILARDFPVVQGSILLLAFTFSLVNLVIDILYAYVDPRIRYN